MEPNNLEQPIEPTPISEPTEPAPTTPEDNMPVSTSNPKNSKALLATAIITSVLALAGIGASIYFFMDSNNKSTEISNLNSKVTSLNTQIDEKDNKIEELETKISSLNVNNEEVNNPESGTTEKEGTATIVLGEAIAETETGTVFKIGECSADGPSVKCPITTTEGKALISYTSTDNVLRFTTIDNQ